MREINISSSYKLHPRPPIPPSFPDPPFSSPLLSSSRSSALLIHLSYLHSPPPLLLLIPLTDLFQSCSEKTFDLHQLLHFVRLDVLQQTTSSCGNEERRQRRGRGGSGGVGREGRRGLGRRGKEEVGEREDWRGNARREKEEGRGGRRGG
eukprot:540514-Hanusia_phi.AAC.1